MPTPGQKRLLAELKNSLTQAVAEARIEESDYEKSGCHLEVRLEGTGIRRVARSMKEKGFHLEMVTALDLIDAFDLVYTYFNYHHQNLRILVRVRLAKEAEPYSVSAIYPAAIWLEREVYDFFGIRFKEHPNLTRIINPDEADYFPLLKNFGKTKFTAEIDDVLC